MQIETNKPPLKLIVGATALVVVAALFYVLGMNKAAIFGDSEADLAAVQQPNVSAQRRAPQAKLLVGENYDDWRLECRGPEGAAPGQKQCLIMQRHLQKARGKAVTVLSAVVMLVPRGVVEEGENKVAAVPILRLVTPVGAFLPGGVAARIDGKDEEGKKIGLPFLLCTRTNCVSERVIVKDAMANMQKGNTMDVVFAMSGPAKPVPVKLEVSLKGFTAAFDAMLKQVAAAPAEGAAAPAAEDVAN